MQLLLQESLRHLCSAWECESVPRMCQPAIINCLQHPDDRKFQIIRYNGEVLNVAPPAMCRSYFFLPPLIAIRQSSRVHFKSCRKANAASSDPTTRLDQLVAHRGVPLNFVSLFYRQLATWKAISW